MAMVDSNGGTTNFHVPNDITIDDFMPRIMVPLIRDAEREAREVADGSGRPPRGLLLPPAPQVPLVPPATWPQAPRAPLAPPAQWAIFRKGDAARCSCFLPLAVPLAATWQCRGRCRRWVHVA
mmetsp:Transcript_100246/g.292321  ORF Transcript_100246/g.292321 Transcript_100246/m.292321 type:complete len:123 (+) Transcript_100246:141-509(+)